MRAKILCAAAILATLSAGQAFAATVVLSDNFNADGPGVLNWTGDATFVPTSPPGSVDLIGSPGSFWDLLPGHGYYVDLDGTTGSGNNPSGQLTSVLAFGPGSYTLSFDLAGNNRGYGSQTTTVSLGGFSTTLTPVNSDPFITHTYSFTTASAGQLMFTESGPSNQQGNLLDNVSLTAVPEPATWAMMMTGLFGLGAVLRRRREQMSALIA